MTDFGSLGSVSVDVQANLGNLDSGFQEGLRRAQAFDRGIAQSMQNVGRSMQNVGGAVAGINRQFEAAVAAGSATWNQFVSANFAAYKQLEGSGTAAMKRLSGEWAAYKAAVAGGRQELARFAAQQSGAAGPGPQKLLGIPEMGGYAQAAASAQTFATSLDGLRAKYNPLYVAQQQYRAALTELKTGLASGVITQREYADALTDTKIAFVQQVNALRPGRDALASTSSAMGATGAGARAAGQAYQRLSFEAKSLSYQLVDVTQGLFMGQSLFMIAAQQAGQIGQVLATAEGGAAGLFKEIGGGLARMITPMTLAIAGFTALSAVILYAFNAYSAGQREITLALSGIGRASGTTREQINAIAKETSNWTTTSTGAARELATEYARVGLVATDAIAAAVMVTKDLAATLGTDSVETAQMFAKALADPAKGVDLLNAKLAAWSDRTRSQIIDFQAQGNLLAAQRLLIDGVAASTVKAAQVTGFFAKTWDAVKTTTGNVVGGLSESLARLTGIGQTLEQELRAAQDELDRWSSRTAGGGMQANLARARVAELAKEVARLTDELARNKQASQEAADNLRSLAVAGAVRSAVPEIGQREDLQRQLDTLSRERAAEGLSPQVGSELDRAIARTESQLSNVKSAADKSIEASRIAKEAATARAPSELASIAYQQKYIELLGQGVSKTEAAAGASAAASATRAAADYRLVEAQRARISALEGSIQLTRTEISVIGQSVGAIELATRNQQTWTELLRTAQENNLGIDWVKAQYNALVPLNQELARTKQLQAELNLRNTLRNDRNDLFMSDSDRQITQQLRTVYGNDLSSAAAQADLAYARMTERIRGARDLAVDFGTTLVSNLTQGKTFAESLNSALLQVVNTLLQMIIKQLVNQAFGPLLQGLGGAGGAAGTGRGLLGGMLIPGLLHEGGLGADAPSSNRLLPSDIFVNAPKFHSGKPPYFGPNEMPAIIDKREEVDYPSNLKAKYGGQNGGGVKTVNVFATIDLTGATGNKEIEDIAGTAAVTAMRSGIEQFSKDGLPVRLAEINRRGR